MRGLLLVGLLLCAALPARAEPVQLRNEDALNLAATLKQLGEPYAALEEGAKDKDKVPPMRRYVFQPKVAWIISKDLLALRTQLAPYLEATAGKERQLMLEEPRSRPCKTSPEGECTLTEAERAAIIRAKVGDFSAPLLSQNISADLELLSVADLDLARNPIPSGMLSYLQLIIKGDR